MRIARVLFLAAASVVFFPGFFAQTAVPVAPASLSSHQLQAIDTFVAQEMARERIPGLAVGVYSRGRVLLAKGYGQANVELSVPVKPETLFQSGSVGKQFVSCLLYTSRCV